MARRVALALLCSLAARARAEDEFGAKALARAPVLSGTTGVEAREAAHHPAALGEPARVLLDAAGAARSSFAGGELSLWGATASESRVYLDGVELPKLFHPGGLRTTVHPALLQRAAVTPGAASAEYGRGLGGVVELTSLRRAPEGTHGSVRIDAIDASVATSYAARSGEGLIAFRQGYLDRVARALFPEAEAILQLPSHRDGALRASVRLDARSRLSAQYVYAHDRTRVERDLGPDRQERRSLQTFHVLSLALERRYADMGRARITPFASWNDAREHSVFARVPLTLAQRALAFGVRAEFSLPGRWWTTRLGLDVRAERTRVARTGSLTLPAREGDIALFGQAPVDASAHDTVHAWVANVAPYLTLSMRVRELEIAPALRLESYVLSASRSTPRAFGVPAVGTDRLRVLPEPRLRITYQAHERIKLEARAGLYHQPPAASDLSAVFGTPSLDPSRALHAVLGASGQLPFDLVCEAAAFYKALRRLGVRTPDSSPELSHALTNGGRGSVWGGSITLRRDAKSGVSGGLVYTLSRSRRTDPDGTWRPFDLQQTHVASGLIGYAWKGFWFSVRARVASGRPRTPVVGRYFDAKSGRYQPLFGAHNRAALPAFFQLDLHAERRFALGPAELGLSLDVWNVTDHVNVEEVAYSSDLSERRDLRGLPLLAMLSVEVQL